MSFSTLCPSCGRQYTNLPSIVIGKTTRCPDCTTVFTVKNSTADSSVGGVATEWKPGDVLMDLYEVKSVLGEGSFGKVFRVHHRGWQMDLAVKSPTLDALEVAGGKENFEVEAETWVNLGLHPHTVSCYYVRRIADIPRVFAEYVSGGDLDTWVLERKLYAEGLDNALDQILDIAIQFAWGLDYAHRRGLIHQDVKPGNLMLTQAGIAKVTDFGLARAKPVKMSGGAEASGFVGCVGMTPAFASPEQAKAQPLSRRTDLWSWAVSILFMFSGRVAWKSGPHAPDTLEILLDKGPPEPSLPRIPKALGELLRQCFRTDPQGRPRSLKEAADRVREIYGQITGGVYPRTEPQDSQDTASSFNNRAVSLLDLGRNRKAFQLWDRALKLHPNHPESTFNRGLLLWRAARKTDQELLREMEDTRKQQEGAWLGFYLTALVHMESNDYERALERLRNAKLPDPKPEEAQIAFTAAEQGLPHAQGFLRTLESKAWYANSVCLSHDGETALTGNADNSMELWEVKTGRLLRTFSGHRQPVNSVSLSGDGCMALSGGEDNTLKLWEIPGGRCVRTFTGHTQAVTCVALSRDGRMALSGSRDATLRLWETATGRCSGVFKGHTNTVTGVSLHPGGRAALSGSQDRTLRLWDLNSGRCLRAFEGHAGPVTSIALPSKGARALSGSQDNTLKYWDLNTGRCLRTFTGHAQAVTSVTLSGEGDTALSASRDRTLRLWGTANGRCLRTFEGHRQPVICIARSGDGGVALSAEQSVMAIQTDDLPSEEDEENGAPGEKRDTRLVLWSTMESNRYLAPLAISRVHSTETLIKARREYNRALSAARRALEQSDAKLATKHIRTARSLPDCDRESAAVRLWVRLYRFLPKIQLLGVWEDRIFEEHTDPVRAVSLSRDNRLALTGSEDRSLKLWDTETGARLQTFTGHEKPVTSVYLHPEGRHALSGSEDLTLRLWDLETGRCVQIVTTEREHTLSITAVSLCTVSRFALSASQDNTFRLWDLEEGRRIRDFSGHTEPVTSIRLSHDGRHVLTGSKDQTLKYWELKTGRCLNTIGGLDGHRRAVTSVSLNQDSRWALSGGDDGAIILWEMENGTRVKTIQAHSEPVTSVSLSPDERHAVSGSRDSLIKIWDLGTRQCLQTLEAHDGAVLSVNFSPDKGYILSGGEDGLCKLWILDWKLDTQ